MKIAATRSNQTEITLENGYTVLFSYSTPVVAHRNGERPKVVDRKYSSTTSRHVNQWFKRHDFDRDRAESITPEYLEGLAS